MDLSDLTCSICYQKYNEDIMTPRMLPDCGHTFCTKCLQGLLSILSPGEKFKCPEDR